MSNTVRIYRTYSFREGKPAVHTDSKGNTVYYRERFGSRVEDATREGLWKGLALFHKAAVTEAPEDTGLLRNSLFYTVLSDSEADIRGINEYTQAVKAKGERIASKHTVNEYEYLDLIEKSVGPARTSMRKGVQTGVVASYVAHYLDDSPGKYSVVETDGLDKGTYNQKYKTTEHEYARYSDDTQYAPYVEYGGWHTAPHPFMAPAAEKVRKQMGDEILKSFDAMVGKTLL